MRKKVCKLAIVIIIAQLVISYSPQFSGAAGESPYASGFGDQFMPAIDGDKVVWLDGVNNPYTLGPYSNVYLRTIGGVNQLINSGSRGYRPAIGAGKAVWEDLRNDSGGGVIVNTDIFGYSLPSGPESAVATETSDQLWPDTSGGRVVWQELTGGDWDIFLKDTSGVISQITSDAGDQTEPRIDGNLIVWMDDRNGSDDIYMYDTSTAVTTRLTTGAADENSPDVSGRKIVWVDWRDGRRNIYYYDLDDTVPNGSPVSPNPAVQHSPRLSGNRVVWVDWRNGDYIGQTNSDIYSANLISGFTTPITTNGAIQNSPDVSGGRVVWADKRNINWDVYMYEFAAPTGSVAVNGGALYANSTTVTLGLTTDAGVQMSFSNDNSSWTQWQPFQSSSSHNLSAGDGVKTVYARYQDADGGVSTETISDSITIDTGIPADPTLTAASPVPGSWAADNTVNVSWSGASDGAGSGIDGYSISWSRGATATPDTSIDLQETANTTTSGPLADGVWWFNLRTRDNAGNWTSTVHRGPFLIDVTLPINPAAATETAGGVQTNVWQNSINNPNFTWPAGADASSGVKGYWYYWGANAGAAPTNFTTATAYDPPAVGGDGTYYLRLKTEDNAGNQSGTQTLFTFKYDAGAPVGLTVTTSTPAPGLWQNDNTIDLSWGGASDGAGSGIDGYSVSWTRPATATADTTLDLQETSTAATSPPVGDGDWWFNIRAKDNLGNWTSTVHTGPFKVDTTLPVNSASATETSGSEDNVWQNATADPNFIWAAGADASAGVKGYYYYWGTDLAGSPTNWTTNTAFNPPAVGADGVYYLRIKTEDNAGNRSAAQTLFTFKYDGGDPANPDSADEAGGAPDNTWQNAVDDPNFSWAPGSDGHSGIKGYWYYWGTSSSGTPDNFTTDTAHDPVGAIPSSSQYYLRLSTEDKAGNRSAPTTVFVFKYDGSIPANPAAATETAGGAQHNVWQNSIGNPNFIWPAGTSGGAGVFGYYYYWGPDSEGTSTAFTTAAAFDPPAVTNPSVNYLRVRTKDNAGNMADWATLFTFMYDRQLPVGPAVATSTPPPGIWTDDNTPYVRWSGATDGAGSGIDGYAVSWSKGATATPDTSLALQAADSTTGGPLEDGIWWFNVRAKDNAGNWTSAVHEGPFKLDRTAPVNPAAAATETGGAQTDVWQNSINDPDFTWASGMDASSGVKGYYYYWGADSSTTPTTWTTAAGYDPPAVGGPGTYYLRVATEDTAGNRSAPATLFVFRYDNVAPTSPGVITEANGVASGSWQRTVADPSFTWLPADEDAQAGVKGYRYYWGTDPVGPFDRFTTQTVFDPPPVAGTQTYSLKVKTEDIAGNLSTTEAVFTFKYDVDPPPDPLLSSPSHTAGVWSSDQVVSVSLASGGVDIGSGTNGYSISWSPGAAALPEAFVSLSYPSGGTASLPLTDGAWWFNLRTVDKAGNWSSARHLGPFNIDTVGPTGASVTINAGAANTNSTAVALNLAAADAGSGPARMRFSNDGIIWSDWEVYGATKSWTLGGGDGDKTVSVQFKDALAYESGVVFDRIHLDTAAPATTVSSPKISTNESKTKSFRVYWSGSDTGGSGIASYDVQVKVGKSGAWTTWKTGTTATAAVYTGSAGKTYYIKARATDGAGNVGPFSGESRTIVPYDNNGLIKSRAGFTSTISSAKTNFFLGTVRYSTVKGDQITYAFTGDYIAVIGTKGPKYSKVEIVIDGIRKVVDTKAAAKKVRRVFFEKALTLKKHTVKIRNLGTAGRTRVELDANAVGK